MKIDLRVTFETEEEFAAYARNFLGQDVVLPAVAEAPAPAPAPAAPEKPKRTRRSKKQIEADKEAAAKTTTDVSNVMDDDYVPDTTPKMEAEDADLDPKQVVTAYIERFSPAEAKARIEKEGVSRIGHIPADKLQEVLHAMNSEMPA